jgi:toxin ParE1/3/4
VKIIRIHPQADFDIDDLAAYIAADNLEAALGFLDAVEKSFDIIAGQPQIGPLRYSHLPMLDGLRFWPVTNFEKHLIFYIEHPAYIDIVRVLHGSRDLPAVLTSE